ncbi:hypothetical protein EOD39_2944 [Acipenser ruthenus]|uniref:CCHC-type domain-containing protein n=1 Tax=Acipenser ruthenus TaxID=7906 RepID=A0A444TXB1_ACIRT|nr:hypothetical protein EOD39_2944 [Acipenser ruthenus]
MGRKSGKKQQKLQQPQQQQQCKRWWSRVSTLLGPPDWAAEQERWRTEGAPMCGACGGFGHVREDCPYGDPQYKEAWNQGLVGDVAEWFWVVDQTWSSPAPKREEPLPPLQPKGEEPLPPLQPKGEEPLLPLQPKGEEPLPPLQPKGEEPLPPSPPKGEEPPPP